MLHITAGKYRGRKIFTDYNLSVRPTMGIVREAIFNILSSQNLIYNLNILDLFCGSGSLSFEGLSRGARHAFMVDTNYKTLQLPKKTSEILGIEELITLICCHAHELPQSSVKCDIVFIDPPYYTNIVELVLNTLPKSGWLQQDAVIILEVQKNQNIQYNKNMRVILERTYGMTKIIFFSIIDS
ncbi:16S rRNA (guanine(966)-N(2))-methyltransferase RsmD [Wolbachia endosymbiont of Howardula sp.]|uniref:16S rRNA (guanine(966)-N(2))-methyltransferase RsmD n=1 Tax=Wolbachia endosymbiont of Howardula sp. TaxID=2916816 RepID=UPI00217CC35F|nr:16S rRNA (guanine(966)-N(2))-methyltransferase RsmD [Wolbachia endosymbiont of Howardula sp.]UWI83229.1 16S rRNA (guanine(966)-N(2))-methyltransferase RsmD [Wolbachia endosymbiont of Howardula sp.]